MPGRRRECQCGEPISWLRELIYGWCKGCLYRMQQGGRPRRKDRT